MKKLFIAFCLLWIGLAPSSAQITYEVPALSPQLDSMCREVVDLRVSNPQKAYLKFAKIAMLIQNRKDDLIAVGDYFRRNKVYPCDSLCAERAYAIAANDIDALKFRAAMVEGGGNLPVAAQMYEILLGEDSLNVDLLYKRGFLNKNSNEFVAEADFLHVVELDPQHYEAWRNLGDLYAGKPSLQDDEKAINSYTEYYKRCPKDSLKAYACAKLLDLTFIDAANAEEAEMSAKFEALGHLADELSSVLGKDNIYLKRVRMLSLLQTYRDRLDAEQAVAEVKDAIKYVEDKAYNDSIYKPFDYINVSTFYGNERDYPKAIAYMQQAIACDSTQIGLYLNLSTLYRRNNQYDEAIAAYKTYAKGKGEDKLDTSDDYRLMQLYFFAARDAELSSDVKDKYIADGDEICQSVINKYPDFYMAYIYKAWFHGIKVGINPLNGELDEEAAVYYAKALDIMQEKNADPDAMKSYILPLLIYHQGVAAAASDANDSSRSEKEIWAETWKYAEWYHKIDSTNASVEKLYEALKPLYAPAARTSGKRKSR